MKVGIYLNPDSPYAGEYLLRAFDAGIGINAAFVIENEGHSKTIKRVIHERMDVRYEFKDPRQLISDKSIPSWTLETINGDAARSLIQETGVDLLLLAAPEIVEQEIIDQLSVGILNSHPSDISIYRGCTNVEWAIYDDHPIKVSCYLIDVDVDAGHLVLQNDFDYRPGMSYEEIRTCLVYEQADAMIQGCKSILENPGADFPVLLKGKYMKVIDDEKMAIVRKKLAERTYRPWAAGRTGS